MNLLIGCGCWMDCCGVWPWAGRPAASSLHSLILTNSNQFIAGRAFGGPLTLLAPPLHSQTILRSIQLINELNCRSRNGFVRFVHSFILSASLNSWIDCLVAFTSFSRSAMAQCAHNRAAQRKATQSIHFIQITQRQPSKQATPTKSTINLIELID